VRRDCLIAPRQPQTGDCPGGLCASIDAIASTHTLTASQEQRRFTPCMQPWGHASYSGGRGAADAHVHCHSPPHKKVWQRRAKGECLQNQLIRLSALAAARACLHECWTIHACHAPMKSTVLRSTCSKESRQTRAPTHMPPRAYAPLLSPHVQGDGLSSGSRNMHACKTCSVAWQ
jgi:hypothetical protein